MEAETERQKQPNQHSKRKKGYCWHPRAKKFVASVQINGEAIVLGAFDTEEEAREAYFDAIERYLLPP